MIVFNLFCHQSSISFIKILKGFLSEYKVISGFIIKVFQVFE